MKGKVNTLNSPSFSKPFTSLTSFFNKHFIGHLQAKHGTFILLLATHGATHCSEKCVCALGCCWHILQPPQWHSTGWTGWGSWVPAKKKKETHRNCVLSWGEVGLRKSNTADVGGKNNYFFLGLLLTACFFFPAFPLHSEAGIVYAHVNVCIMLNS